MAQCKQQPYSFGQGNSKQEVVRKGFVLLRYFVCEEAKLKQIEHVVTTKRYAVDVEVVDEHQYAVRQDNSFEGSSRNKDIRSYDECDNALVSTLGKELRKIANEFATSAARQKVKKKAEEVKMSQLSLRRFNVLLLEMFSDGMNTRESIVTLFFCSDVVLKGSYIDYCMMVMMWSCSFINDCVSNCKSVWIYQNGGWEKVLCSVGGYVKNVAHTFCIAAVGITTLVVGVAAVVHIRQNI
ncbi:uncharacterized protein LOC143222357 [Tachypleus tridentatus]|uniref:uncharacterized protein LOC143222357 n=1 Tax=Tachypleus tridentatus TaxID=6853 RepID=UPI003FD53AAD